MQIGTFTSDREVQVKRILPFLAGLNSASNAMTDTDYIDDCQLWKYSPTNMYT